MKAALSRAKYTIKGGEVVVRNGELVAVPQGRTYWVEASVPEDEAAKVRADLVDKFAKYYSIQISNYMVQDAYVTSPRIVRAGVI